MRKPTTYPFVIYATYHRKPDTFPRTHIVKFEQVDDAAAWLYKMLGGERLERVYGTQYIMANGIKLSSDRLEEIAEGNPLEGHIDDLHSAWIASFKYGSWDEDHRVVHEDEEKTTSRAPRPERVKRPGRPEGYVSITELCAASGMPAMIARAALRASGRAKPEYGWCFAPNEIAAVKKLCGMR